MTAGTGNLVWPVRPPAGAGPYLTVRDDFLAQTPLRLLLAVLRAKLAGYDESPIELDRYGAAVGEALVRAIPVQCARMAVVGTLKYRLELRQVGVSAEPVTLMHSANAKGSAPCFAAYLYDGGGIAFSGGMLRLTAPAKPDVSVVVRPRCNRAVLTRTDVSIELMPVAAVGGVEQDLFILSGTIDHDG